jgi:P4 family phage/plasmid primase-like protien
VTFRDDSKALYQTGIGHVFPILPGAKKPAVKGAHGIDSEKPSVAQIKRWWEQFGDANTGLAPRPPYFILDIDQHDDKHGFENLAKVLGLSRAGLAKLLYGAPRVTSRPDRGHGHYYFRTPDDFDWETHTLNRYPAKDVETIRLGYYVVAPGSLHAVTGREYELALYLPGIGYEPERLPIDYLQEAGAIPVAPPEIMALLTESARARVERGKGEIYDWIEAHDEKFGGLGGIDSTFESILAAYEAEEAPYDVDNHDAALRVQIDLVNAAERESAGGLAAALDAARDLRDLRDPGDWERFLDNVAPPLQAPPVATLNVDNSARVEAFAKERERAIEEGRSRGRGGGWQYATSLTSQPYEFVSEYLSVNHRDEDDRVLLRYFGGGRWGRFDPEVGHYVVVNEDEVTAQFVALLKGCTETVFSEGSADVRPVVKTPRVVSAAVKAMATKSLVSEYLGTGLAPLRGVVPFRNGLLDVETGEIFPVTADWDVWWNVPLDFAPGASCPSWVRFLGSIGWGEHTEEYRLLRQWFGYLLSGLKDQQKMLLLKGPTRGGKGTILKIAGAMLGDGAVGITLQGLTGNFGLQPMLGRSLATIGDARFENRTDKVLVERLLSIVGDDEVMVDVKNQKPVSTRLDTRLMMASNEVPKFIEASDALAQRFVVLESEISFLGREDLGLERRLRAELAGIVEWSLEGLRDLQEAGSFAATTRGQEIVHDMIVGGSSVRRFVEERCEFGSAYKVLTSDLYQAYAMWARARNLYVVNDHQFGQDIRTAFGARTEVGKSHGRRTRKGLRLREGDE